MRPAILIVLSALLAPGCAHVRFQDQPVVWSVSDTEDIEEPRVREYHIMQYMADVLLLRGLPHVLTLPDKEPARNTNALDEVPASSWWNHRMGMRAISPEQLAVGPAESGPPQLPLTIVGGKGGGGNPGFLAKDGTGRTFVVKFDRPENPEMQTATGVIVNRLFWGLGYNVPADTVFWFDPASDLLVDPEATWDDELGHEHAFEPGVVSDILAPVPREADGRIRAIASEFLSGTPVGGFAPVGRRRDDPNDVFPHQHRRELRGMRVFAAWTGHSDMKEDNTLDMYVEEDGRHFLRHYLLDFGEALGAHQAEKDRPDDGYEYLVDWGRSAAALFSFGLWEREWERQEPTPWLSVGLFSGEHFVPAIWREAYPYRPFSEADPADLYWGAKHVLAFSREHVRAAVEAGQLSDPGASDWLVDALMERRERIGEAWLEAVSPVDWFAIEDGQLCMTDLGVHYGLADLGVVERVPDRYEPLYDDRKSEGERGVEAFRVQDDGRVCLPPSAEDGYLVDRLRVRRGRDYKPILQVHYRPGPDGRVLGVLRVE